MSWRIWKGRNVKIHDREDKRWNAKNVIHTSVTLLEEFRNVEQHGKQINHRSIEILLFAKIAWTKFFKLELQRIINYVTGINYSN